MARGMGDENEVLGVPAEAVAQVARWFHEAYEQLAPSHGWETQERSRKAWEDVPVENKRLMIDTAAVVLSRMTDEGMIRWQMG